MSELLFAAILCAITFLQIFIISDGMFYWTFYCEKNLVTFFFWCFSRYMCNNNISTNFCNFYKNVLLYTFVTKFWFFFWNFSRHMCNNKISCSFFIRNWFLKLTNVKVLYANCRDTYLFHKKTNIFKLVYNYFNALIMYLAAFLMCSRFSEVYFTISSILIIFVRKLKLLKRLKLISFKLF